MTNYDADEILLQEDENRYVLFPIRYPEIWKKYQEALSFFWTVEELDLHHDIDDWNRLTDNEKFFISRILAFFAASDGIVIENLVSRFASEIKIAEVRQFYAYQNLNEAIHSHTYSLLIDTYIRDENEKNRLLNAIQTIPAVARKANWAKKWISDQEANFAIRLLAFAAVEGILFSGSFCAIYWLKKRGLMHGLTFSNELISRDEGQHVDFACLLYGMLKHRLDQETVHQLIKEAVEVEKNFIIDSIPCKLIGMNADMMSQYIEFVADRLLTTIGYEKIWNSKNPFEFMELISLRPKTNFFERRVGEYQKSGVGKSEKDKEIKFVEEF